VSTAGHDNHAELGAHRSGVGENFDHRLRIRIGRDVIIPRPIPEKPVSNATTRKERSKSPFLELPNDLCGAFL
jgi:hypothetical protein